MKEMPIAEISPEEVGETKLQKLPVTGYLAWYRFESYPHWTFLNPIYQDRDIVTCPYPLFKNQHDIQLAANKINYDDMIIKIVKITL